MDFIILDNADLLLSRLMKVNNDPHLVEKFYPLVTKHALSEKAAIGIVMILNLAIYDYCKGMPSSMYAVMNLMVPRWIDALTEGAPQAFRDEAQAIWLKIRSGS